MWFYWNAQVSKYLQLTHFSHSLLCGSIGRVRSVCEGDGQKRHQENGRTTELNWNRMYENGERDRKKEQKIQVNLCVEIQIVIESLRSTHHSHIQTHTHTPASGRVNETGRKKSNTSPSRQQHRAMWLWLCMQWWRWGNSVFIFPVWCIVLCAKR